MALDEDDIDEGYIASAARRRASPARISRPPTPTPRSARRSAPPKPHGRLGRLRHRLPPEPLGPRRPSARARSATSRSDTVTAQLQAIAAGLRPDRRHRGGDAHRRRRARHARGAAPHPRAHAGDASCASAARWAAWSFPAPIPDDLEDGIKGPGFPVEVFNVLGAGDAFMAGFLRGWLRDEPLETGLRLRQRLRRLRGVAPARARPSIRPGRSCSISSRHGAATPRLRHDPALDHIHWATTRRPAAPTPDGACDRPPLAARGDGGPARRAAGEFRVQAAGRAGGGASRASTAGGASRLGLRPRTSA